MGSVEQCRPKRERRSDRAACASVRAARFGIDPLERVRNGPVPRFKADRSEVSDQITPATRTQLALSGYKACKGIRPEAEVELLRVRRLIQEAEARLSQFLRGEAVTPPQIQS